MKTLDAIVSEVTPPRANKGEEADHGRETTLIELASPTVGVFTPRSRPGDVVDARSRLGGLVCAGQRIQIDAGPIAGRVEILELFDGPRGYGQPLARVRPLQLGDTTTPLAAAAARAEGLPDGAVALPANVDGQFYRSPSPEDPPFVEVDSVLQVGAVVGLIEVMKFFYEVTFELPATAPTNVAAWRVVRIDAADSGPIESGNPVLWVVPSKD